MMRLDSKNQIDIDQRRDELKKVLEKVQEKEVVHVKAKDKNPFHMPAEFVSPIIVGICLGWLIDSNFGISPVGLVVFLLLGFVVGVINIVKMVSAKADQEK